MTHPTPEQVDGAIERITAFLNITDQATTESELRALMFEPLRHPDLRILLSVVERQREALEEAQGTIFALAEFIGAPTDTDDEPCDDLCGNPICASVGCLPMKLRTLAALTTRGDTE